jgi:type I restriction enzyme S subunit
MQTGRDECIRIGLFQEEEPIIVSPAYTTFEVKATNIVLPEYLFMIFLSKEKDRLGWFLSDSSIRSNLDWDRFCEIELVLPTIEVQKKYVRVYDAIQENLYAHERGLEDFRLSCGVLIEKYERNADKSALGELIHQIDERNTAGDELEYYGINRDKEFMPTAANTKNLDPTKYKIIRKDRFVFSGMQTGRDECIRIGLFSEDQPVLLSPAYTTFEIIDKTRILPEYLFLLFLNPEMDRYGWFLSDGSIRSNLDWDRFCEIEIKIPSIEKQKDIANVYRVYNKRKSLIEKLNNVKRSICPTLIKGSLMKV